MNDIFISYRRNGGGMFANEIYNILTANGYNVFYDIYGMAPGKYPDQLITQLSTCRVLIAVLTNGALDPRPQNEEDWMLIELAYALSHNITVIPILCDDFSWPIEMPESLKGLEKNQFIKMSNQNLDDVTVKLVRLLDKLDKRMIKKDLPRYKLKIIKKILTVICALFLIILLFQFIPILINNIMASFSPIDTDSSQESTIESSTSKTEQEADETIAIKTVTPTDDDSRQPSIVESLITDQESVPEVYSSKITSYSGLHNYDIVSNLPTGDFSMSALQDFSYAFSIVSHIKNPNESNKKIDNVFTTITELETDTTLNIGANAVIYNNQLEIFLINDSWGTSDSIEAQIFFRDENIERPLTDFTDMAYSCDTVFLSPGDIIKCAVYNLDLDKFNAFLPGYNERNSTTVIPLRCKINDGVSGYEKGLGWIAYNEARGGFYLSAGGGDVSEAPYSLLFLKLDVDKTAKVLETSDACNFSYIGKDAYPVVDNFLTVETAIAPTKSCYLKCFNTFEIDGQLSKTSIFQAHVKVPYYVEGTIDVFSNLSSSLAEADAEGITDLKNIAKDYVYNADNIIPH